MAIFDFISDSIKGFGNFLIGSGSVIGGFLGEIFGRIVGIPGFILDLFGLRATKHLRIKFVILADENGQQLIPKENVLETLKLTKRIFMEQAEIEVHDAGTLLVGGGAPTGALDVRGPWGSFFDQWLQAGTYLSSLAGFGTFTRRLSVIVVRSVEGDAGRSFGPTVNFVVIQQSTFSNPKNQSTLIAHEIGHACGLYVHRKQRINLMHKPGTRGEKLTWWQSNVVRGSRFVWYW